MMGTPKDNRFYREPIVHNEVKYVWEPLDTICDDEQDGFSAEVNKYLKEGFFLKETIVACDCIVQVLFRYATSRYVTPDEHIREHNAEEE